MKLQAVVIGASRGIGLALSQQLLANGYQVIGTSRTGRIDIKNEDLSCLPLDVTQSNSREQFADQLRKQDVKIDLLINNAGIGPDLEMLMPNESTFDPTFDVNVKGIVMLTEEVVGLVKEGGKILNVSSKLGSIKDCTGSFAVFYCMSKSALNMYTKILSNRLAGRVDVAAIHPGWVRTTLSENCRINGRLSPDESASGIMDYITNRFANGDFWDAEDRVHLEW